MTRARDLSNDQANLGGAVAPFVAGKNFVINGGMDIWQRGISSASTGGYFTADRWYQVAAGTTTHSQDTDVPTGVNAQYSIKWVTSASSSYGQWYTALEQANVIPLRGQKVTASAYIKSTGYTGALILRADYSTSTDAIISTTTFISDGATTGTASTSWVRVTNTFTVPSNAVGLRLSLIPDTAQASGVTVKMAAVQLELGSVATPFSRSGGSIGGELALCQRYYVRYTGAGAYTTLTGMTYNESTTRTLWMFSPFVPMRIVPTAIEVSALEVFQMTLGTASAITSSDIQSFSSNSVVMARFSVASGLTVGTPTSVRCSNNAAGYFALSAEL
jgi:hypothetical protein